MKSNLKAKLEQVKLLAVDTSTSSMTVALMEGGRTLKEINSHAERNHSIYLIPHIQQALAELGWSTADLEGIAVGRGPGSYTGVRIGITVAKTMAWALKLPVVGVSSLEAMAAGGMLEARPERGAGPVWLIPMMNARRGQVYTGLYSAAGEGVGGAAGGLEEQLEPVVGSGWTCLVEDGIRLLDRYLEELLERIAAGGGRGSALPANVVFAGEPEGFEALIEKFRDGAESLNLGVRTLVQPYRLQATYIGRLGLKRLLAGEADDAHLLLPNYTQLAEAEVKLLGRK